MELTNAESEEGEEGDGVAAQAPVKLALLRRGLVLHGCVVALKTVVRIAKLPPCAFAGRPRRRFRARCRRRSPAGGDVRGESSMPEDSFASIYYFAIELRFLLHRNSTTLLGSDPQWRHLSSAAHSYTVHALPRSRPGSSDIWQFLARPRRCSTSRAA